MQRPYPDYVVANDQLLVGINFDEAFTADNYQLGAALQRHNLLLETLNAQSGYDGLVYGYLGPGSLTVGAIRDFAHWQDVANAVAQAVQELGGRVSNQAATVSIYTNVDITQPESQQFTKAASDQTLFTQPQNPLSLGWQEVSKDVQSIAGNSNNWFLIAGAALLVVVVLSSRKGG